MEKLNIEDESLLEELTSLDGSLFNGLAEDLIRTGAVDPRGKTQTQITTELIAAVRSQLSNGGYGGIVVDHTTELERTAKSFEDQEEFEYAIVFYATWFEHWLNRLIACAAHRKYLPSEQIMSVVRRATLKQKLIFSGPVSTIFICSDFSPIPSDIVCSVLEIAEIRNEFIHYKWQGWSFDEDEIRDEKLGTLCKEARRCTFELQQYEKIYLSHGLTFRDNSIEPVADMSLKT